MFMFGTNSPPVVLHLTVFSVLLFSSKRCTGIIYVNTFFVFIIVFKYSENSIREYGERKTLELNII